MSLSVQIKQVVFGLCLALASLGFGAMDCKEPFLKVFNPKAPSFKPNHIRKDPSQVEPPFRGSREEHAKLLQFLESPLSKTTPLQALLKSALGRFSGAERKAFSDWLFGQFAEDAVSNFEDHYLGRQKTEFPEGPLRHNKDGERPFDGYLAAREHLSKLPLESISLDTLREIHKKLMSRESIREDRGKVFQTDGRPARNSQGLKDSELGLIRDTSVGFEVDGTHLPQGVSAVGKTFYHLQHLNPFLEKTRDDFIRYAPLSHWYHIDTRRQLSDKLVKKIKSLETKYGEDELAKLSIPETKEAQRELVEELTQKIWDEAKEQVKSAATRKEVISAVARFQKDFASVHPFLDGNGRMARLLTEKLLESSGLSSPLYVHFGEDVTLNRKESEDHLAQSIALSEEFQASLMKSILSGNGYQNVLNPVLEIRAKEILGDPTGTFDSPAFLEWTQNHREAFSTFPDAVQAFAKSQTTHKSPKTSFTSEELERIRKGMSSKMDTFKEEEFTLWLREHSKPGRALEEEAREYANWLHDFTYEDKSGAIRLASPSFQRTFGKLSSTQEEYDQKMRDFYSTEKVYRGVPSDKYLSDLELAQLLVHPSTFILGNGVSSHQAPESALPVFQQFNAGLLRDESHLRKQVIAHKNGLTDDYFMSGMVSFSEKKHVAEHWSYTPAQLYGFIFVGRQRQVGVINTAKHTLKLDQLGMHNEFEEAMVGGVDPESLMTVDMFQHVPDSDTSTPRRFKRASRIGFDKIQISETTFDEMERPRLGSRTLWQVFPDGTVRQIVE